MADLKPCPFCGVTPAIKYKSENLGLFMCRGDPCHGSGLWSGFLREDEHKAIAAWNTRATQPEVTELVEALRPFAKSGEIFPGNPGDLPFDQCIYNPAAGQEYSLCGDDLRRARVALAKLDSAQ